MGDETNDCATTRYYRHGEPFWRELIARQEQSGMGVRKFCVANGVARGIFHKWRAMLREDNAGGELASLSTPDPMFIAVAEVRDEMPRALRSRHPPPPQAPALRASTVDSVVVTARQLWEQLEIVKHQLTQFVRARFGASSEPLSGQVDLFVDTVVLPVPPVVPGTPVASHIRRGRPALPKDLPRERIEYDLTEAEKAEFDGIERIGVEVSETLDYTPARLTVIEHARIKYACRKDGESTIRTAFAQPSPLPKSNASAVLLAQIGAATFVDHMPLHRQAIAFARKGIVLSESTLCDWKLRTAELVEVLMPVLKRHILAAPRVHSDDTTLSVRQAGRSSTRTARLWGYLGAGQRQENGLWVDQPPAVMFEFALSREAIHPLTFFADYAGYLHLDAYSGYQALYRTGRVVEVSCWAHCRRRFFQIAKVQKTPG